VKTAAIICTVKYEMRYCVVLVSVAVFIETFITCLLLGLLWPLFYNYKLIINLKQSLQNATTAYLYKKCFETRRHFCRKASTWYFVHIIA